MSDFKQRLFDEKIELADKRSKLQEFISYSTVYSGLPVEQQYLLTAQLGVMNAYLAILRSRIALLDVSKND